MLSRLTMSSFDRNNIMVALLGLATNSGKWPQVPAKHGFRPNGHVEAPPLSETVEIDSPVNGTLLGG